MATNTLLLILVLINLCLVSVAKAEQALVEFRGQWSQGGILVGRLLTSPAQVFVGERNLIVSEDGLFVVGLGRDQSDQFQITIVDDKAQSHEMTFVVKQRHYDIQRIEGVQQKHVDPPPEVSARIARDAALVYSARDRNDQRDDFTQPFIWPVTGPITGVYGSQRVYNGVPKSPHYGVDIAAPKGTKVKAPASGIVTLAEPDLYFSGGTLIVDHGHGLSSTFIHLHKVLVTVGQRVDQGEVVGEVGATGRATGPHLDWRMNWFDQRVDPQLLMIDIPMAISQ